jgi:hypothetical protein
LGTGLSTARRGARWFVAFVLAPLGWVHFHGTIRQAIRRCRVRQRWERNPDFPRIPSELLTWHAWSVETRGISSIVIPISQMPCRWYWWASRLVRIVLTALGRIATLDCAARRGYQHPLCNAEGLHDQDRILSLSMSKPNVSCKGSISEIC